MGIRPYRLLAAPRDIDLPRLPSDLSGFYSTHEGIGLECDERIPVRLCMLAELSWLGSLQLVRGPVPETWQHFSGIRLALGTCGEDVTYVLSCPSAPRGAILAFGDHCVGWGGGGFGQDIMEGSLVLALSFEAWLYHMEKWGWVDPILAGIGEWKDEDLRELRDYYLAHNPSIDWPIE